MTLDELLTAARADPGPTTANRQFWRALQTEIKRSLARQPYATREEVGQRVMVIVWRKIDRYEQRGPDSLRRWVWAIIRLELRHTAFEAARLALLEAALLRESPRTPGLTPTTYVLYVESLVIAEQAIRKLSDRHHRALVLAHPPRISESEGISVDAARMLLHRALRRLIELMSELRGERRVRSITSR